MDPGYEVGLDAEDAFHAFGFPRVFDNTAPIAEEVLEGLHDTLKAALCTLLLRKACDR